MHFTSVKLCLHRCYSCYVIQNSYEMTIISYQHIFTNDFDMISVLIYLHHINVCTAGIILYVLGTFNIVHYVTYI